MTRESDDTPVAALPAAMPLRVAQLSRRAPTTFDIAPDGAARALIAGFLGLSGLRKLRFKGALSPRSDGGWDLAGTLGATVVQPCTVTLAPVSTRIDAPVTRRYLPDWSEPDAEEAKMPDDLDSEPLGQVIDPAAVMIEELALAIPPYPRAPGAELGDAVFTEPGKDPMHDDDARPLDGLAALRDRMGE